MKFFMGTYLEIPSGLRRSQPFYKMNQPLDFHVSHVDVCMEAGLIIEPRIRGHLMIAFLAGPFFGGLHQLPANPLAAQVLVHVPALDIAYGAGLAAFRVGTGGSLKEPHTPAIHGGCNEDRLARIGKDD